MANAPSPPHYLAHPAAHTIEYMANGAWYEDVPDQVLRTNLSEDQSFDFCACPWSCKSMLQIKPVATLI